MITNKDIRVENGNLVLNGDKFPLDGQSPETIMEIVEDNSDTTPTENSTAPITSGGVFTADKAISDTIGDITQSGVTGADVAAQLGALGTALGNKQNVIEQVNFVDCSVNWPSTGTDAEKVASVATQVLSNLTTTKAFNMICIKDGSSTPGEMIFGKISGNYGIGIFMSYYINGIYKVKNVNGTVTVVQLAEVS